MIGDPFAPHSLVVVSARQMGRHFPLARLLAMELSMPHMIELGMLLEKQHEMTGDRVMIVHAPEPPPIIDFTDWLPPDPLPFIDEDRHRRPSPTSGILTKRRISAPKEPKGYITQEDQISLNAAEIRRQIRAEKREWNIYRSKRENPIAS